MVRSHLWHGFTDMSLWGETQPFTITHGEGPYLYDDQGRRYLDGSSGLWFANIGHGRRDVAEAAARQMSRLAAYSTFGDYTNEPAEALATRLAHLSPTSGAQVFFTSGGSDSVDSAIKLTRRFWQVQGQPQRRLVISRENAYHGGHMGSTALGGIELDREGYGELITDTARIPWDSADALEQMIDRAGPQNVAAFILEPVIAAGGVLFPPDGYLHRVAELCHEHGIILIADEVVNAFGRQGDWFACTRFGIEPDIVVCAKGLTSGYMPLGALIVNDRVSEPFYDGSAGPWFHGYTWSGHAAGAAVAMANLHVVENEKLAQNVLSLEPELPRILGALADHALVSGVRTGTGLMAAVELDAGALAADPSLPRRVAAGMRTEGVLTRSLVGGEIQFSPPLVIDTTHVQLFASALRSALDGVARPGRTAR